jgi:hypothetical protein
MCSMNKKNLAIILSFIFFCSLWGGGSIQATTEGITPQLRLDKDTYAPGDQVNVELTLTGTQAGDKTNSVTFEIAYDSQVVELATGSVSQDVQDGYIPFTTKDMVGSGTIKSIKVMYVHPETDIKLVEGAKILSISFKVNENATEGNTEFTLQAVDMLDSQFNYYAVNQGQPVTIQASIVNGRQPSQPDPNSTNPDSDDPTVSEVSTENTALPSGVKALLHQEVKTLLNHIEEDYTSVGPVYDIAVSKTLTLSYKDHLSTNINEEKLGVYLWDQSKKSWAYVGGKVNLQDKSIQFTTESTGKYTIMEYHKTFADLSNHWAKSDIELMAAKHIVKGKTGTSYAPKEEVTRAQFAALLVRALGIQKAKVDHTLPFTDVQTSKWYYNEVAVAYNYGIINGLTDTSFGPNVKVTREQMAVMIIRAMTAADMNVELTNDQVQERLSKFKDQTQIAKWAEDDVAKATQLGIINGRTEETFVPSAYATRAESAVMLRRLLNVLK